MSHPLVPSDRVEAAVVYGPDGQKIGTIERLMLEKLSGTSCVRGSEMRRSSQRSHTPLSVTVGLAEIQCNARSLRD